MNQVWFTLFVTEKYFKRKEICLSAKKLASFSKPFIEVAPYYPPTPPTHSFRTWDRELKVPYWLYLFWGGGGGGDGV